MKTRINEIIKTLIDNTKNDTLIWSEKNPNLSTSNHKRTMSATGEDGTVFDINIEYKLKSDSWELESDPCFFIRNASLPDGVFYVGGYTYKETSKLRDIIKNKFCKDLNPKISDVKDTLASISKGVSLSTHRDNALTKVLGWFK